MEAPAPAPWAIRCRRCGRPHPRPGVPRTEARWGRWNNRAAMNLSSSPLARGLSVTAGALLLTLAAGGSAQAADRGAQLRADRTGAEQALLRAQTLARGRGIRDARELTPALTTLAARLPALLRGPRRRRGAARASDRS